MYADVYFVPMMWNFHFGSTTKRFLDLGVGDISNVKHIDLFIFPVKLGDWEGAESIDAFCGIHIDGFSAQTEPYSLTFKDVDDFIQFGIVSSDLETAGKGFETASGVLSLSLSLAHGAAVIFF